jgi:hypothetical protein
LNLINLNGEILTLGQLKNKNADGISPENLKKF